MLTPEKKQELWNMLGFKYTLPELLKIVNAPEERMDQIKERDVHSVSAFFDEMLFYARMAYSVLTSSGDIDETRIFIPGICKYADEHDSSRNGDLAFCGDSYYMYSGTKWEKAI